MLRMMTQAKPKRVEQHGTVDEYIAGCRCDLCIHARTVSYMEYYAKIAKSPHSLTTLRKRRTHRVLGRRVQFR